jgi:hypothetical protein
VISPRLTRQCRDELQTLGVTIQQQEPGIWRLHGGPVTHPTWVLETAELAGLQHPLLTLVSPRFLEDRLTTDDLLRQGGHNTLVVYLAQQINQFRLSGKEFAMQHLGADEDLGKVLSDKWDTMSPEERRVYFPLEKWLARLPLEDRLRGLTPDQLERVRQLLQQQPSQPTQASNSN